MLSKRIKHRVNTETVLLWYSSWAGREGGESLNEAVKILMHLLQYRNLYCLWFTLMQKDSLLSMALQTANFAFTFSLLSGSWSSAPLLSGARGSPRQVQCLSVCQQQSATSSWGFHTLVFTTVSSTSQIQKTLPLVSGSRGPCLSRSCDESFCFGCHHKGLGLY